ncbi:hypothetical protein CAEBREN_08390 [Caenorhabditis brenneri]|uniref:Uncharacterized protein n=1 Tax=Caenorhabditis brenneri TaxID=135651 RepID=G0PAP9_CAEBE|nr:hypothetical protein CAEBREN_08390 [Caenorhabditis brenneri]
MVTYQHHYELFPNTPQLYFQIPKCRVNSESTNSDSAIYEPSTSEFDEDSVPSTPCISDNEDNYSELSDFDPYEMECDYESEKSLEEIQDEIDEAYERIFASLDQLDASIEEVKVTLQ